MDPSARTPLSLGMAPAPIPPRSIPYSLCPSISQQGPRTVNTPFDKYLFLAFVYNGLAIPLAALGLLNPLIAGAAMSVSSLSVMLNLLRLHIKSL